MATINIAVTPRHQISPDSENRWLLTPDIINDMARPIVEAEIEIDEAALIIPTMHMQITVANDGTTSEVGIQVLLGDDPIARYCSMTVWLTQDASTLALAATMPSGNPLNQWKICTNGGGVATLNIVNTGTSDTWYLCAEIGGIVYVSDAITIGV